MMKASKRQGSLWALSGVSFVALFFGWSFFSGLLAPEPYPPPFASSAEIERYFTDGQAAVRLSGFFQVLAAVSLLGFAAYVSAFVRRIVGEASALPGLALGGGVLSAAFLALSGSLLWVLARPATGEVLALVRVLHDLAFLAGGPVHVSLLGLLVGAGSIAALRAKALPLWISGVGIAAATLALLSVSSMFWFSAGVFVLFGRLLSLAWIVGFVLVLGQRREPDAGS